MASVTFSTSVGGDGSTVSDDTNPSTGLDNNGHRTRLVPALAQVVAIAANVVTKATNAATSATNAALSYSQAAASALAASISAMQAANSAIDAQGYAALAQAVSPDSPMRLNTKRITADFTILADYNAVSAGPIEISQNTIVTVNDGATWSIV